MSKKKITIIICTAVIIIFCAVTAILFIPKSDANSITEMLSTAQKYLVEADYERAIAEFNKIIELDPMNTEAYLGLAEAYEKNGQHDKAIETLEKGYEATGDARIKSMLELLTGSEEAEETEAVTTAPVSETETESTVTEEIPTMPDLKGMTVGEAVSVCSSMGIEYTVNTVENAVVKPGVVMGQSVMADTEIDGSTSVVIIVSGRAKAETTVTTEVTTVPETTVVTTTTAAPVTTTVPVTDEITETTEEPAATVINNKDRRLCYYFEPNMEFGPDDEYKFYYDEQGRISKCIRYAVDDEDSSVVYHTTEYTFTYSDDMKTIRYSKIFDDDDGDEHYEYEYEFLFDGEKLIYVVDGIKYERAIDRTFEPSTSSVIFSWYDSINKTKENKDEYGRIISEEWKYQENNEEGEIYDKIEYDEFGNIIKYQQDHKYRHSDNDEWQSFTDTWTYKYEDFDSTKVSEEIQHLNGLIIGHCVYGFY